MRAPEYEAHNGLRSLMGCSSVQEIRALAPLPDNAQREIDKAVVEVGLDGLSIVADVMSAGLVYKIKNPFAVMELYQEKVSRTGSPKRTMTPGTRGQNQIADRTGTTLPIYATVDDFEFNIRTIMAAEASGLPLNTDNIKAAVTRSNESFEDAFIHGADITVSGNTTPGLLDAPNVNTQAYVDNEAWTAAAHSGQDMLDDVLNMIDLLQAANRNGPYHLWLNTTYGNETNKNFSDGVTTFDDTILERLKKVMGGGKNLEISVADKLPADRIVMAQMTKDVVEVVEGLQPTVFSWEDGPKWNRSFAVLSFIIPRVKDDYDGNSGICTGNLT